MEIRRVDPELIPPPVASEHGAEIEFDRRHREQGKRRSSDKEKPKDQSVAEQHEEMPAADTVIYGTEGHLHKCEVTEHSSSSLDVFA